MTNLIRKIQLKDKKQWQNFIKVMQIFIKWK